MDHQKDVVTSKIELVWGAASLFLFLVGAKRSFRRDDGIEVQSDGQVLCEVGAGAPTPPTLAKATER